jgi:secreted trypsin-like serine protease
MADWPWLVSVFAAGQFICNGTLIAPRMVLSAANCVGHGQPTNYEVAIATDDGKYLKIGRRIPVTKIVVHPAYSEDTAKGDIAILELGTELPPPFATISAQRSADPKAGTLALVGTIDFRSKSGNLLQSSVPISSDATCAAKSAPEGTICAGFERGGAGACPRTGSAGGPLAVFSGAGRKYQIGIVSVADCSVPEAAYGVYTRISSYADWIKQVVPDVPSEPVAKAKR